MRGWSVRSLIVLFGVALLCALSARAQTSTGMISGRVLDQQGGVVPGAEVVLTQTETGVTLQTVTDETGNFVFPAVQPGKYTIAIGMPGFKRLEQKDLILTSSERLFAGNLRLEIGEQNQSITVLAEATPIQLTSQERSAMLNDHQLGMLASVGRDYMQLLKTLPGVTYDTSRGSGSLGTTTAPYVSGIKSDYVSMGIDGVVANNRGLGNSENMINLDAVAEVKILMGNYQAEYGKNAGAIINVVTKSGTQDFHGTGYWFKRHEMFNANDWDNNRTGAAKGRYRYNTIGGNIGGPISFGGFNPNKDKLFFFFSTEYQPNKSPSTSRFWVPTELERNGDFSQSFEPLSTKKIPVKDPLTGKAFPNDLIPANRIEQSMQRLLKIFPLPTAGYVSTDGKTNYQVTTDNNQPKNQELLRIDFNPTEKLRTYFRGMDMSTINDGRTSTANSNSWGVRQSYDTTNPNIAVNVTYLFSPTLVNELSLGMSRWTEVQSISDAELDKIRKDKVGYTLGQLYPQNNPLNVVPGVSFSGLPYSSVVSTGYDGRFPMENYVNAFSISDGISKVFSQHTLKTGVYLEYAEYLQRHHGSNFTGNFAFGRNTSNPNDAGHAFANALLGEFNTYTEVTQRVHYQPINKVAEWYVQDNWRVAKRLTLDYGLRFTYDIPQYLKYDIGGNFYPELYDASKMALLYIPAINPANKKRMAQDPITKLYYPADYIGKFVPGSGNPYVGSVPAGTSGLPRGFVESNGLLYAPRLGFAWDPFGDGKTAIRAGVGVYYNARPRSGQMGDMSFNPPTQARPVQYYGNTRTFLNSSGLLSPSSFNRVIQPDAKMPVIYQMSFGIQRSIGFDTVVDVAYSGNVGNYLGQRRQLNQIPYGAKFAPWNIDTTVSGNKPLPDSFLRPYVGYEGLPYLEFGSESSYHSLQTQVRRNFRSGLQYVVAWTWSKAMNYGSGDDYQSEVAAYLDHRFWDYAPAGYDRTHQLTGNWVWDVPKASRVLNNPLTRWVLDNWQLAGTCAFVSGTPRSISYSTTTAEDVTGGGDGSSLVLLGEAQLPKDEKTLLRYFDTGVFRKPVAGNATTPGEVGSGAAVRRYAFRGPGINNWDLSFVKNIPVTEGIKMQFRWEMYNAFNHTQFDSVDTAARFDNTPNSATFGQQTSKTFGQINGATNSRVMQGSLRISF